MIFNSRKLRKVLFSTLLAAGMGVSSANAAGNNVFKTLGTLTRQVIHSGFKAVKYGSLGMIGIKSLDGLSLNFKVGTDARNAAFEKCEDMLSKTDGSVKDCGTMLLNKVKWAAKYKDGEIVDNKWDENVTDMGYVGIAHAASRCLDSFMDGVVGDGQDTKTVVVEKVIVPQQQPAPQFYGNQPYGPNGIMM